MVRTPRSSSGEVLSKGAWTTSEDNLLVDYVRIHGEGRWSRLSRETGLKRCGKSCRLRWMNYLRPDIKRGNISDDEEELIIRLHKLLGNRWSLIAGRLPGRTDNEIKNYWNTNIVKKKPELLLRGRATFGKILQNSYPNPPRNDNNRELPPEQTNNADAAALQQTNEINLNHHPKLASDPGLTTHDNNPMQRMLLSDSDYLSDGSLSLMSSPEDKNPNDFIIDFTVEDICQILDADFPSLGNVNLSNEDCSNINCFINECKSASPAGEDMGVGQHREANNVAGFHLVESFFGPDDDEKGGIVGAEAGVGCQSDNTMNDDGEVNVRNADVQPGDIIRIP